jgi:tetratricopeptide (TPR) repeat protein
MQSGRLVGGWIGTCLAAVLVVGAAQAREEAVLAVAYGHGVHAYHSGDYQRAYDDLSAAIDGGTQDPRAFYFRGLAALKLGRYDEAEADFGLGADREAMHGGDWPVGRSLERIQGQPRLQLEKHRVRARLVAMEQRRQAALRRYLDVESARPDVQRRVRPENAPGRPTPAEPQDATEPAPAAEPPAPAEPVAEPEPPMEEKPAEKPAEKPGKGSDDPFGDSPF